jgi:ferredoxin
MSHLISDDCVSCGACQAECPAGAISERGGRYVIDDGACSACGTCTEACPVGACRPA